MRAPGLQALPALGLALMLALTCTCGTESRAEGRQKRLDTFRRTLPADVRAAFDSLEDEEGCVEVAELLSAARSDDPALDAALDSIMHAELIDTFTDEELVRFFWRYFAHAIKTGTVPEP